MFDRYWTFLPSTMIAEDEHIYKNTTARSDGLPDVVELKRYTFYILHFMLTISHTTCYSVFLYNDFNYF